jgi:hypothetical protein
MTERLEMLQAQYGASRRQAEAQVLDSVKTELRPKAAELRNEVGMWHACDRVKNATTWGESVDALVDLQRLIERLEA